MPTTISNSAPSSTAASQLIQDAIEWSYDKNTRTFEAKLSGGAAVAIRTSALAKVDPRLPAVVREIAHLSLSWKSSTSTTLQLADRIRKTIDFWEDKKPLLAWAVEGPMYVGRIHTAVKSRNDLVKIKADTWGIRQRTRDLSYIDGVETLTDLEMQIRVLEEHYPGLESRLAQGELVGLSPADMAHHIFSRSPVEAESLPQLDAAGVST